MKLHRFVTGSCVSVLLLVLTGCQMPWSETEVSPLSFFPETTSLLFLWDMSDSKNIQTAKNLWNTVLSEDLQEKMFNSQDSRILDGIKEIGGDDMIFSLGMNMKEGSQEDVSWFFALKIEDNSAYKKNMDTWVQEGLMTKTADGYVNENQQLHTKEVDGFLLGASTALRLKSLDKKTSVLENESFKKLSKNLPEDRIGTIFVDADFFTDITNLTEYSQEIPGIIASISAQSDGFDIRTFSEFGATKTPDFSPKLVSKIPSRNPLIYFEGFNFPLFLDMMKGSETNQSLLSIVKDAAMQGLGVDWDTQISPWASEHYSMLVESGESFPNITLSFSTEKDSTKAKEFIKVIDSFISIGLLSMGEQGAAMTRSTATIGGEEFTMWSVDILKLPDGTVPPEASQILSDLRLFYGVTKDNVLVISTNPLITEFGSVSLDKESVFTSLQGKISQKNQGLFFLSPSNIVATAEKFLQKNTSVATLPIYENVQSLFTLFAHIPGIIFANSIDSDMVEGQTFVKIQ